MELSTLPARKESCLLALRTSGLVATSWAADAGRGNAPGGAWRGHGAVRSCPFDDAAALAPVGASAAIAADEGANDARPR